MAYDRDDHVQGLPMIGMANDWVDNEKGWPMMRITMGMDGHCH